MNIEIWSIGKNNEPHIQPAIDYYLKKVRNYNAIQLLNISSKKSSPDPVIQKKYEEELILSRLQKDQYLILMDERGKMKHSPELAEGLLGLMDRSVKTAVFLIGGAFGVTEKVYNTSKEQLSFSKMVFPHQLVRVMLAEQIYRAFSIIHRTGYHHA